MKSPSIHELPKPEKKRTGWPWTTGSPILPDIMPDGNPWPLISIVTPSFNQGFFLEETIRSVLLQGYPNIDYYIFDGGSTDNTVEIIKKYTPWITYYESKPDRGQSHAINKGWEKSKPGIWAWLNSDDVYLPGVFAQAVKALADNPAFNLVYADAIFTDESTAPIKTLYRAHMLEPGIGRMKYWIDWPVPQPTVFFKSNLVNEYGLLDERFRYALDYEWLVRLSRRERFLFIKDFWALYRIHTESKTATWEENKALFHSECRKANFKNASLIEKLSLFFLELKRAFFSPGKKQTDTTDFWSTQMVTDHMQNDCKVVYFTRFSASRGLDGGVRRMLQMRGMLEEFTPTVISSADGDFKNEPIPSFNIDINRTNDEDNRREILTIGEDYYSWSPAMRFDIAEYRTYAHKWSDALTKKIRADIAIVDDPIFFMPLVEKLSRLQIPIISIEHNLETLVPGQVLVEHQYKLFKKEIDIFRKCNLVITISHEDTVLLRNFGINAYFFTYYPTRALKEPFDKIRNEREKKAGKQNYLLIGSAYNIPTGSGMLDLARHWLDSGKIKGDILYVIGFGTEVMKPHIDESERSVKILGSIDEAALSKILTEVKGCIIYQEQGTGALTRIIEMLIAGVPVIANHHAARSYHNVPGVIEYSDLYELDKIIEGDLIINKASIPMPSVPDTEYIATKIRSIITDRLNNYNDTIKYLSKCVRSQKEKIIELEREIGLKRPVDENLRDIYNNFFGKLLLSPILVLYKIYVKLIKKSGGY